VLGMAKHLESADDTETLALTIPTPHPELFRHKATNDILRLLVVDILPALKGEDSRALG